MVVWVPTTNTLLTAYRHTDEQMGGDVKIHNNIQEMQVTQRSYPRDCVADRVPRLTAVVQHHELG